MVSKIGKRFLLNIIGEHFMKCYYRAIFIITSAILMFTTYFLIESVPDTYIFKSPPSLKWPMHIIQVSGMFFGMSSLLVLDASGFFGIKQIKRRLKSNSVLSDLSIDGLTEFKLVTNGVYSIVRHPIYLAGIIMISFQPNITYNWFAVTILADMYFIYAAIKEEILLLGLIGSKYREYRKRVPMFNIFKGVYLKCNRSRFTVNS